MDLLKASVRAIFVALCATLLPTAPPALAGSTVLSIAPYTSAPIKTLRLDSVVVYEDRDQLNNIGGDFADFYQVQKGARSLSLIYAQPGRLRYDATVIGAHITYIVNGDSRATLVPFLHVHKVENIAGAPGKKNTLLDSGVVPPEQMTDYDATFLRRQNGLLCFQLLGHLKSEPFKDLVWLDPKTHITVQRYHYDRNGVRTAWYLYKNPVQVAPGIYFPTRVEVYSPQNKLAGVTVYKNIRVNTPVDPATFNE